LVVEAVAVQTWVVEAEQVDTLLALTHWPLVVTLLQWAVAETEHLPVLVNLLDQ
jgi:hypothetical protein